MHLFVLKVTITYEHGSMRDTSTYDLEVTIPAIDLGDALPTAEDLVQRYHEFYKHRSDYQLQGLLSHMRPEFANREKYTDHHKWSAHEGDALTGTSINPPNVRNPEPVFCKKMTLAELKADMD